MSSRPIYLRTENLSIGYRSKRDENRLLENQNLVLREAEMICFMGPNGSGKSSLLRTLAGLQRPLEGSVTLEGRELARGGEHHVAVVLTDRIQSVNLTVGDVVAFGRYPYLGWNISLSTNDRYMIDQAINLVGIQPMLKKKLYQLSDGQLQMVMIARALAQDTRVLLLDEPTAHLDLNNRVEIMNLLRQLSRSTRKSILLATHELDLALQTADLIWLAGKDRQIMQGLPEDLVLNGAFDDIFRFKGFDLKSGKVLHQPFRNVAIQLSGEGPAYLWTKNALERTGFEVGDTSKTISVAVVHESASTKWLVTRSGATVEADSIEKLIELL